MPVMMVAVYIISLPAWASLWPRNKFLLQYQEYVALAWVSLNVLPIGITSKQKKTNQAAN